MASPIGLRSPTGVVRLNPPMDTVIGVDDDLVMLAEDDVLIQLDATSRRRSTRAPSPHRCRCLARPRTPCCSAGTTARPKIVRLLDSFAEPGSRLVVASQHEDPTARLQSVLLNMRSDFGECDLNDRDALEKLDVGILRAPDRAVRRQLLSRSTPTPARWSPCCTCATCRRSWARPTRSSPR